MIIAQALGSSVLLVALGAVITGGVGYLTSTAQFRRQQKVDHERWLREEQLSAYRILSETLRSPDQIRDGASRLRDNGESRGFFDVRRSQAPTSLRSALAGARLVSGGNFGRLAERLDSAVVILEAEEGASLEHIVLVASAVEELQKAMRDEIMGNVDELY